MKKLLRPRQVYIYVRVHFAIFKNNSIVNLQGSQCDDIYSFCASYALLLIETPAVKYLRDVRGVTL